MAGKAKKPAEQAGPGDEPDIETRKGKRLFLRQEESEAWAQAGAAAEKALQVIKAQRGRPAIYTDEKAETLLGLISEGISLRRICAMPDMPSIGTVWNWLEEPSFLRRYARAREQAAHALFDQAIDIADDATGDLLVTDDGKVTSNPAAVARAKLRVETRFKMAAKLAPKVYSDRLEGVAAGNINVQVNSVTVDARQLEPDQRDKLRQLLLEARPIDER